jgi:hypothetical protein
LLLVSIDISGTALSWQIGWLCSSFVDNDAEVALDTNDSVLCVGSVRLRVVLLTSEYSGSLLALDKLWASV